MTIETIIAATITTSGTVISAWLINRWKNSSANHPAPNTAAQLESTKPVKSLLSTTTLAPAAPSRPREIALSHKQISESIDGLPPFQRPAVHQSFVGARVTWPARLFGVDHFGDHMTVSVNLIGSDCLVFCRTTAADCEGIDLAPEGSRLLVTGDIHRIDTYESELTNCRIIAQPNGV
jgi:hypothetical protein